jgi:hypothetical protein
MINSTITKSIILNAAYLGSTTNDAMAVATNKLPKINIGRYCNVNSKQLVEVKTIDAKGVHYQELSPSDQDSSILQEDPEIKLMNVAVFSLSHQAI